MEQLQLLIGRLLLIGVFISLIFVAVGGCFYLQEHGSDIVHYQVFQIEPKNFSLSKIIKDALSSSVGAIQFGLLFLVFVQILRVGLTLGIFVKLKDYIFVAITSFILLILIYSLIRLL